MLNEEVVNPDNQKKKTSSLKKLFSRRKSKTQTAVATL